MGILDYTKRKHPGGFTGYRVCRKLPDGEIVQAYFDSDDHQSALKLDNDLAKRQVKMRDKYRKERAIKAVRNGNSKSSTSSGIRGLSLTFSTSGKGADINYYPAIRIQATSARGKIRTTRTIKNTKDANDAWSESCRLLASHMGLKSVPRHWGKAKPERVKWLALRRYYNKVLGHNIPLSAMERCK